MNKQFIYLPHKSNNGRITISIIIYAEDKEEAEKILNSYGLNKDEWFCSGEINL